MLSASGASRWMNCTPSARMEEELRESGLKEVSSDFAAEGTLAHEISELDLRIALYVGFSGEGSDYRKWKKQRTDLTKHRLYKSEMENYVSEYVEFCLERFSIAKKLYPSAICIIEGRADFSQWVDGGYGTSDFTVVCPAYIEVIDLKYGKGVQVFADENAQLRLYGLGMLSMYDLAFDFEKVRVTIVQPRLHHIDSEESNVPWLLSWADTYVKPAADKALKGEGECVVGDWCRWCKAKPVCRTIAEVALSTAKKEFKDLKTLSDKEKVKMYKLEKTIRSWIESLSEHMHATALKGTKYEGLKLVRGRGRRQWVDEEKAIGTLSLLVENPENLTKTKLASLTTIESMVGKKEFKSLGLTTMSEGAIRLVPEEAKGEPIGLEEARKDFE